MKKRIRALRMEPGQPAKLAWIEPDKEKLEMELGGEVALAAPRVNIAIIHRDLAETDVLPANRIEIYESGYEGKVFYGTIYAVGRDRKTGRIHSLTKGEFRKAMSDYGAPSFKQIGCYGLQPGEELRITKGIRAYFEEVTPRRIEVVKEYRWHVLCEAKRGKGKQYQFSINKSSIHCGDIAVVRMATGEMLG